MKGSSSTSPATESFQIILEVPQVSPSVHNLISTLAVQQASIGDHRSCPDWGGGMNGV